MPAQAARARSKRLKACARPAPGATAAPPATPARAHPLRVVPGRRRPGRPAGRSTATSSAPRRSSGSAPSGSPAPGSVPRAVDQPKGRHRRILRPGDPGENGAAAQQDDRQAHAAAGPVPAPLAHGGHSFGPPRPRSAGHDPQREAVRDRRCGPTATAPCRWRRPGPRQTAWCRRRTNAVRPARPAGAARGRPRPSTAWPCGTPASRGGSSASPTSGRAPRRGAG